MVRARGGAIINMSSVVGLTGNAGQMNYAASKAAVIGLTKALAKELASRNIRVNCIAPGFIQTAMTEGLKSEELLRAIPLGRLGTPEEVADMALFLASDLSTYVTGQVLSVDGGMAT
jgi:3-oxoacyl-[acyl-carrier protein] reductase